MLIPFYIVSRTYGHTAGKSIVKEAVSSPRVMAVLTAERGGAHLYSQHSQGGGRQDGLTHLAT